jgi:hypothetical protein
MLQNISSNDSKMYSLSISNFLIHVLMYLKSQLKSYPSLLEKRLDWIWRASSFGRGTYNYQQRWQELPGASKLSNLLDIDLNFYVRLPLEKVFHVAVKYDDLSRAEIDPALRLGAKRHPGLALDISTQDMLANYFGKNLPDSLKYCDGYLYIDEYKRDLARVSYSGSLQATEGWSSYGFLLVIA